MNDTQADQTEAVTDHEIRQLMRYIERTTDLRERVAHALAYNMHGYSSSGIATKLETSQSTVRSWLDEILARYGPDPLLIHDPEQPDIEPLTRGDVLDMAQHWRHHWEEAAATHTKRVPEQLRGYVDSQEVSET